HHLLDARWVDAPVENEFGERDARDLAADRIEAREDDRLGGVIDNKIHAGGRLQRANIAPHATDDTPLHIVIGQRNDGNRHIADLVGSAALYGQCNDLAGFGLRLLACSRLDLARPQRGDLARLLFDRMDQLLTRLLLIHTAGAL